MAESIHSQPLPRPRRWIDLVLIAGGAGVAWFEPAFGAPLVVLGAVMPLVHAVGVHGRRADGVAPYAPRELVRARSRIVRASAAFGPDDTHADGAIEDADDVVLEAAAIFAGRPVRGALQRRYVRTRVTALEALASDLEERAAALAAARDEVDGLDVHDVVLAVADDDPDGLATVLLWLLAPVFVAWELVGGAARAALAFVEGLILRSRLLVRFAGRGILAVGRGLRSFASQLDDAWRRFRTSWVEARRRFISLRLRLRLRLHRARKAAGLRRART